MFELSIVKWCVVINGSVDDAIFSKLATLALNVSFFLSSKEKVKPPFLEGVALTRVVVTAF